jgi:hypothetical protein
MLKQIKIIVVTLSFTLLGACQSPPDVSIGSPLWLEWVESVVQTGDGQGHGPDIGSEEWCRAVDQKLFAAPSVEPPCSAGWQIRVNDEISH